MVRVGTVIAPITLLVQFALLAMLAALVGLSPIGWLVGLASTMAVDLSLAYGLSRSGTIVLGRANQVTLIRATLVCGISALVAQSLLAPIPATLIAALAVLALVLDALDGWLARHTGTVTTLGARFDMEVDAFLILVLSVYVAAAIGPWVLAIGAARYAFGAAAWFLSWLREPTPPSYRYKTVAAIQGIVLTIAVPNVMTGRGLEALLITALVLLVESFRHQVCWLWRHQAGIRREVEAFAAEAGRIVMAGSR